MNNVLVTGGAGYIGAILCSHLLLSDDKVLSVDNLSTGSDKHFHISNTNYNFLKIDLSNRRPDELSLLLEKYNINQIVHLAAKTQVGESINDPVFYYHNNINTTLNVLNAIKLYDKPVDFVFASTATVYDSCSNQKIRYCDNTNPQNPYAKSKLYCEKIIKDLYKSLKINPTILRFFNVYGTHYGLGEQHVPETHLIPCIIKKILNNDNNIEIYGNNYNTKDGTAIRDYIHVYDVVECIKNALNKKKSQSLDILNVCSGVGYTNKQIISYIKPLEYLNIQYKNPRPGDVGVVVGDYSQTESILQWKPTKTDIHQNIKETIEYYRNY